MIGPVAGKPATAVTLFNQGLVQLVQAAVTGLEPGKPYTLALATTASGDGPLQPLAGFMTNPAGAAVVNSVGPIRQIVEAKQEETRRYLVIAIGSPAEIGAAVLIQMP